MSWLGLVAVIAAGSLLLVVLLAGLLVTWRRDKTNHNPLRDRDLPQSHDGLDPWTEAGKRHGSED